MTCVGAWSFPDGGTRRILHSVTVLLLCACAALAVPERAGAATAAASQEEFKLDHFLCYGTDKQDFQPREVRLRDQFGKSRVRVLRRVALCNPVQKKVIDGGDGSSEIGNRAAHLVCYAIERAEPFDVRRVKIDNQFDRALKLEVHRPVRLCLPSGKSEDLDEQPEIPGGLDHFQCYRARSPETVDRREVLLRDQFGDRRAVTDQPGLLCNPTAKDVPGQHPPGIVENTRDHLVCYRTKSRPPFQPRTVRITNQFEQGVEIRVHRPRPLCLPSLKEEIDRQPEQLPDLQPTIIGRTYYGCSSETSCLMDIEYEVNNLEPFAAGPFSVLASADPAQTAFAGFAGLGPMAATGPMTASLGPSRNCFDPDCTYAITVDPSDAVDETDELNNVVVVTERG